MFALCSKSSEKRRGVKNYTSNKTPKLTDEQKAYLKTKAANSITAFGGTGVVPDNHIADIAKNSI